MYRVISEEFFYLKNSIQLVWNLKLTFSIFLPQTIFFFCFSSQVNKYYS